METEADVVVGPEMMDVPVAQGMEGIVAEQSAMVTGPEVGPENVHTVGAPESDAMETEPVNVDVTAEGSGDPALAAPAG